MTLPVNWVERALMPKGPTTVEKAVETERARKIGDAVHFHQWKTAHTLTVSLLAFVERQMRLESARREAKANAPHTVRGRAA